MGHCLAIGNANMSCVAWSLVIVDAAPTMAKNMFSHAKVPLVIDVSKPESVSQLISTFLGIEKDLITGAT